MSSFYVWTKTSFIVQLLYFLENVNVYHLYLYGQKKTLKIIHRDFNLFFCMSFFNLISKHLKQYQIQIEL